MNILPSSAAQPAAPGVAAAASVATPCAQGAAAAPSRWVTDAPTRVFHALFALSFVGAYASAESERWRMLHVALGYSMAALLVFRLLYGLLGPRHARLAPMWRRVAAWPAWLGALRTAVLSLKSGTAPAAALAATKTGPLGQTSNLARATATAVLLLLVAPLTLSGYAAFNEWGDVFNGAELLEEVHGFFGETLLLVVLAHMGLIVGLSLWRRKNQALPMLTGRVPGKGPHLVPQQRVGLAVALGVAVLALVLVVVLVEGVPQVQPASAPTPSETAAAPARAGLQQVSAAPGG